MGDQAGRPCAVKRNATGCAGVQSSVTPLAKQESPCAFKRNEIEQKPVVELTCVCCCCLASVSLSNVYMYADTLVQCMHMYRYISPMVTYILIH